MNMYIIEIIASHSIIPRINSYRKDSEFIVLLYSFRAVTMCDLMYN